MPKVWAGQSMQSASVNSVQPTAQQPSWAQVVIGWCEQVALQSLADPCKWSFVQGLLSSQFSGQLPSQISPGSICWLPQAPDVVHTPAWHVWPVVHSDEAVHSCAQHPSKQSSPPAQLWLESQCCAQRSDRSADAEQLARLPMSTDSKVAV